MDLPSVSNCTRLPLEPLQPNLRPHALQPDFDSFYRTPCTMYNVHVHVGICTCELYYSRQVPVSKLASESGPKLQ